MNAAFACKPEDDEVAVVSTEVLESNVAAMRGELTELKTDLKKHREEFVEHRKEFVAAVTQLDYVSQASNDIKAAVLRLDHDIKSAVTELRAEIRAIAAKAASDLKEVVDRIDRQMTEMRADFRVLGAKVDATNEKLTELSKSVNHLGNKLNAMFWAIGGLIAAATFIVTVGKAVGWF